MKRLVVLVATLALLGGPALAQQGFTPKPAASAKKAAKSSAKHSKKAAPSAQPVQSRFNRQ